MEDLIDFDHHFIDGTCYIYNITHSSPIINNPMMISNITPDYNGKLVKDEFRVTISF